MRPQIFLTAVLSIALCTTASAQEAPYAFVGATVYPVTGPVLDEGTLVIHRGRIVAVGPSDEVDVPANAVIRDMSGRVLMPGLVDTHSHIGGGEGGDRSSAFHPTVRILDTIDPRNDRIHAARAGGITTVNIMPGSGHLLSGQTAYLKLRHARTIEEMLLCVDEAREVCGGIKMANGTNPRRDPPFPGTRSRASSMVREIFVRAQEYRDRVQTARDNPDRMPPRDLGMEVLVDALEGRRIIHHHTHRHDDILAVLRLAEEFGLRVVLHHVSDALLVAGEIAASGLPSSIIIIDSPGGKEEAVNLRWENAPALARAGAPFSFHTDDGITDSRLFLRMAAFGVRAGLDPHRALEAVTIEGARQLDLEERVGSLEPGKDADFLVLSGDPFSVYTQIEETWVEGSRVFDLSDPIDRRFAVGGAGLSRQYDEVLPPEEGLPATPELEEDPR